MAGFINIAIKEKYNCGKADSGKLSKKGTHIMRQHNEETLNNVNNKGRIDTSRTVLNQTVISQMKEGETLNMTVNRIIEERQLQTKANSVKAVAGIISIPTEYMKDPQKLKLFEEKAKDFFNTNEKLKGNVVLAQTNYDETQPHIEFIFIPHSKITNKLDFNRMFGSVREREPGIYDPITKKTTQKAGKLLVDGKKSLSELHDEVALKIGKPLGLDRGTGLNTNNLTNKQYQDLAKTIRNADREIKEPEPKTTGVIFKAVDKDELIQQYQNRFRKLNKNYLVLRKTEKNHRIQKQELKENYDSSLKNIEKSNEVRVNQLVKDNEKTKKELEQVKKLVPQNSYQAEKLKNELKAKEEKELEDIRIKEQKKLENQRIENQKALEKSIKDEEYRLLKEKEKSKGVGSSLKYQPPPPKEK